MFVSDKRLNNYLLAVVGSALHDFFVGVSVGEHVEVLVSQVLAGDLVLAASAKLLQFLVLFSDLRNI